VGGGDGGGRFRNCLSGELVVVETVVLVRLAGNTRCIGAIGGSVGLVAGGVGGCCERTGEAGTGGAYLGLNCALSEVAGVPVR
jgi:hypothetical protein